MAGEVQGADGRRLLARLPRAPVTAVVVALLTVVLAAGASIARADGDPGSDVLVNQTLFATSNAGLSVAQQVSLGGLLRTAEQRGFVIRVAIIASRGDLGAVPAAFRKPRAYAGFLGYELSLAYTGRLVVMMPNGFRFYWHGHPGAAADRLLERIPVSRSNAGYFTAIQTAVRRLAAAAGVRLPAPGVETGTTAAQTGADSAAPGASPASAGAIRGAPSGASSSGSGRGRDITAVIVFGGLLAVAAVAFCARLLVHRRVESGSPDISRRPAPAVKRASRLRTGARSAWRLRAGAARRPRMGVGARIVRRRPLVSTGAESRSWEPTRMITPVTPAHS